MTPKKRDYFYKTPHGGDQPKLALFILRRLITVLLLLCLLTAAYFLFFRRSYPSDVGIVQRVLNNFYVLRSDLASLWQKREVVSGSEMPKTALTAWTKFNLQNYIAYSNVISEQAYKNKIDPDLVRAVIVVCSHFETDWSGYDESQGLMCLRSKVLQDSLVSDLKDPAHNVGSGTAYLARILAENSTQLEPTLARYYQEMLANPSASQAARADSQQDFVGGVSKAYALLQSR